MPPGPTRVTSRDRSSGGVDVGHLLLRPTKRGQRDRQRRAGRPPRPARGAGSGSTERVLEEDGLLQPLQRRAGLDAELLGQVLAPGRVGPQRLGLPARPVQRPHQLAPQALPQRVGGHQPTRSSATTSAVAPERQLRLEAGLEGRQAQLLQPGGLGHGEGLVGEVGQRRAPPQRQGVAAGAWPPARRRPSWSAVRPSPSKPLEAAGVDEVGVEPRA